MTRDDIVPMLVGGAVVALIVAFMLGLAVARYRECRTHFSAFYCLSGQ